jgi:hypothetical protein
MSDGSPARCRQSTQCKQRPRARQQRATARARSRPGPCHYSWPPARPPRAGRRRAAGASADARGPGGGRGGRGVGLLLHAHERLIGPPAHGGAGGGLPSDLHELIGLALNEVVHALDKLVRDLLDLGLQVLARVLLVEGRQPRSTRQGQRAAPRGAGQRVAERQGRDEGRLARPHPLAPALPALPSLPSLPSLPASQPPSLPSLPSLCIPPPPPFQPPPQRPPSPRRALGKSCLSRRFIASLRTLRTATLPSSPILATFLDSSLRRSWRGDGGG